jgi:hypothetical protein
MRELYEAPKPLSPDRWSDIGNRWYERLELVGSLIPRGASVLDLGAGAEGLRSLVSGPYTPADLFTRSADTLPFDMEADIVPSGHWDCVVMSGVLEYATQPQRVMERVRPLAPLVLLTYQIVGRVTKERVRVGFNNHLSEMQLRALCKRAGFGHFVPMMAWGRQGIYRLW